MNISTRLTKLEAYMPRELPLPIIIRKRKGKYYDCNGKELNYPREGIKVHPIILDYDEYPEYDPERKNV